MAANTQASAGAFPENLPNFSAVLRRRPTTIRRRSVVVCAGLFLWVPVLLSLGIALWFALPFEPGRRFYYACVAGVATVPASARLMPDRLLCGWPLRDLSRLAALGFALVILGLLAAGLRAHLVAGPVLGFRYYGPVEGRVIAIDRSSRDLMRLTLDQVVLRDTRPEAVPRRVRLSLHGDGALPEPGQRVMMTAHLGPPPGPAAPGSHDFRRHAWFQGLGAVGYVRTPVLTVEPPRPGGALALHRLRMRLAEAMRARIGGQEGAVAAALMTGDRSGIEEATNEVMRASNLYHIISISGLHMAMLAGFVYTSLRLALAVAGIGFVPLARWPVHKLAAAAAMAAAAVYLWLSGGGVATERAFITVAVMLGAVLADRRAISLRTVAVAATLILLVAPESLLSAGFQMSFAATIGLVLMMRPWAAVAPRLPALLRPVAMLVISSAVAGAATAPIAAAHFNRMAEYGILANLLAVPVMGTLVMPCGVIAALLAPIGLSGPFLWLMGLGCRWLLIVSDRVASLDGAVSAVAAPPGIVLPLLGAGAVLAILLTRRGYWRVPLGLGGGLIAAGLAIWVLAARPQVLIAPQGEAVGILTPAGRVPSKPGGGKFSVETWLREDGDLADPAGAASRPLWTGDARARVATLGDWRIVHLTGKGAEAAVEDYCRDGSVVVAATRHPAPPAGGCLLFDETRLRDLGALSLRLDGGEIRIRSSAEATGYRAWTRPR